MNTVTGEEKDKLIEKHLHKHTQQSLFRVSLEHFWNTGRSSGSFRQSLHEMMEEYATSREAKLIEALEKCDKTFGKIDEIFNALKSAGRTDLPELVNDIDIDLQLIQAKIRDTIAPPVTK